MLRIRNTFIQIRIQILLVTLMRIRNIPFILSGTGSYSFQKQVQNIEKVLNKAHIPCILACHLQIDVDLDPAYHFDTDPDLHPTF